MWKKLNHLAILFVIIASNINIVKAQTLSPTSYPDVVELSPPVISIRSLNTGEPLRNGFYGERDERNTHWTMVDKVINNKHFVQFKALDTEQCLILTGITKSCSDTALTTFILVPTDTGAFILASPLDGSCMMSKNFRDYSSSQCLRPLQLSKPVDLVFLWSLSPPFGKSKLLVVPTN